jgi:hypothetical protein
VVDVERAGVGDLLLVVVRQPLAVGQLAAGLDRRRLGGLRQQYLGACVAAVGAVEARVPVLELVAGVAGPALVGDRDLVDGVGEREGLRAGSS